MAAPKKVDSDSQKSTGDKESEGAAQRAIALLNQSKHQTSAPQFTRNDQTAQKKTALGA